ncbi:hypothetical protein JTB14_015651 [Gonioctena quinquepunctata]|nr:hypothetical protein JTB14_015651 [Gonioctena quinquepunctata]
MPDSSDEIAQVTPLEMKISDSTNAISQDTSSNDINTYCHSDADNKSYSQDKEWCSDHDSPLQNNILENKESCNSPDLFEETTENAENHDNSDDSPLQDTILENKESCNSPDLFVETTENHDNSDDIQQNPNIDSFVSEDSVNNQFEADIYSTIIEAESICVSNEVELGHDVPEDNSTNGFVESEIVNSNIVDENASVVNNSHAENKMADIKDNRYGVISDFLSQESKMESIESSQEIPSEEITLENIRKDAPLKEIRTVSETIQEDKLEVATNTSLAELVDETSFIGKDLCCSGQEPNDAGIVDEEETEENSENIYSKSSRKRKSTEDDSTLDESAKGSNSENPTMRELSILIDNSIAFAKSSPLSSSPKKREKKSIETVVNHLREKESKHATSSPTESNWIVSPGEVSNDATTNINSPSWLGSEEIPEIHSEVVVSSDQQALIPTSVMQGIYPNEDLSTSNYTIEPETADQSPHIEQISDCGDEINPFNFLPTDEMFDLGVSRQSPSGEDSTKAVSCSATDSLEMAVKPTSSNLTTSVNDAGVAEILKNLKNLKRLGKATFSRMQTSTSSFVRHSIISSQGDKPDFLQALPTLSVNQLEAVSDNSFMRNEDLSGWNVIWVMDISPSKISIGSTQTLDLISTQNHQSNQNNIGQISRSNSFNASDSGTGNEITDIMPVSKQAEYAQSFPPYMKITEIRVSYEENNSDHSYFFPADPVMSIAGEGIFPKSIRNASSELPSNDNPLRDFDLPDDFAEFLNTKQVSEEKDSEEKDSETNQNDDYKLRIDNETIAQNSLEIARQSKEINKLYDLLDCDISAENADKIEPDYTSEPSRQSRPWEQIVENDHSTQKVIVLPNNQCLTPTFNMSHTDLFNCFVTPTETQCINPANTLKESPSTSSVKKNRLVEPEKPKMAKKTPPAKKVQELMLPTRSYSRTRPAKWIKSSKEQSVEDSELTSSPTVDKQNLKVDLPDNSTKEVVSTDNLLELSLTKPLRVQPAKIDKENPTPGFELSKTPNKEQPINSISGMPKLDNSDTKVPVHKTPTMPNPSNFTTKESTLVLPRLSKPEPISKKPVPKDVINKIKSPQRFTEGTETSVVKDKVTVPRIPTIPKPSNQPEIIQKKTDPTGLVTNKMRIPGVSPRFTEGNVGIFAKGTNSVVQETKVPVPKTPSIPKPSNSIKNSSAHGGLKEVISKKPEPTGIASPKLTENKDGISLEEINVKNPNKQVLEVPNTKVYSKDLNIDKVLSSKQNKVVPVKTDIKSVIDKLPVDHKEPVNADNIKEFVELDAVVQNIADVVKSRKRGAAKYSEEVVSYSHSRPKRRKIPTEQNVKEKLPGSLKTKIPVELPAETNDGIRNLGGNSSSSPSIAENPLKTRLRLDAKTLREEPYPKPSTGKYSSNYSIERILAKEKASHESRCSIGDTVERSSSKTEPEPRKTEDPEDPFDQLLKQKDVNPFFKKSQPEREKRYSYETNAAYRRAEGNVNVKSHCERQREELKRASGPAYDQRSQERSFDQRSQGRASDRRSQERRYPEKSFDQRDSRTAHKWYSGQGRKQYLPEQRRSSGSHQGVGPSRHNSRQPNRHSGSTSRVDTTQPYPRTHQKPENSRGPLRSEPKLSKENFKELFNSLKTTVSSRLNEMSSPKSGSERGRTYLDEAD